MLLGQAGTTVKNAYDVLVSMSVIAYFIPYLLMFAALVKLDRRPAAMFWGSLGIFDDGDIHRIGGDSGRRRSRRKGWLS